MAGSYASFAVHIRSAVGVVSSPGSGLQVKVRLAGAGADAAESPLTTDANGEIAAGSIAAGSAGTKVYFRVENRNGIAGCVGQTLT